MIRPVKAVTVDASQTAEQNAAVNDYIRQARQVIPRRLQGLDAMAQLEHVDDDQDEDQNASRGASND